MLFGILLNSMKNKMKQNKILNLTNPNWKSNPKWVHVGHKITKTKLTKPEKIANTIAVINIPFPTCSIITSPIIIKIGQRMARGSKVKLR